MIWSQTLSESSVLYCRLIAKESRYEGQLEIMLSKNSDTDRLVQAIKTN